MTSRMDIRIGHGYDLHQLVPPQDGGKPLILGGVPIVCDVGPISHSDGDAVLHALTDAILSAIGEPDLGMLFPNTNPTLDGAASSTFLVDAIERVNAGGWAIGNVDITVICDKPKIAPYREQICTSIFSLIAAPVNIKGKTYEGTSRSGAIEVHVVALVQKGSHS